MPDGLMLGRERKISEEKKSNPMKIGQTRENSRRSVSCLSHFPDGSTA